MFFSGFVEVISGVWTESIFAKIIVALPTNNVLLIVGAELQKRADRADQSVLFFLAGANFWEKHAKNRQKHAKTGENMRKTGAFLVLIFLGGKIGRC